MDGVAGSGWWWWRWRHSLGVGSEDVWGTERRLAWEVSLSWLPDAVKARQLARGLAADPRLSSLVDMSNALGKQSRNLLQLGRHFVLELSWIERSTESLSQIVQRAILARFPATTRRITLEESHTQLRAVRSEKFVTSTSPTILGTFDAALTTLGNVKLDTSPSIDDSPSKFYVQVVSMCANFLVVVEGGSGTAPLTGTKALAFQLEKYEKEVVAGKAVNISELES